MISLQALVGLLVPAAGLVIRLVAAVQRGGLSRRLREHARLRQSLKQSGPAIEALDELLGREAATFRDRELYRLRRKLEGVQLGLSIFFLLLTGAAAAGLTQWVAVTWGTAWVFLSVPSTLVVVIVLIAFTAVGFSGIYSDPENPKPPKDAKR